MRARLVPVLAVLVVFASTILAASPLHPVPERFILGVWSSEDGSLLLELKSDKQAILSRAALRLQDPREILFGQVALRNRLWTVAVTDLSHRTHELTLVSLDMNRVNALRPDGSKTVFHRIGFRLEELDRNHDGMVSTEEVQGSRLALQFLSLDRNRDGLLSPAEFVTYWQRNPPPVVLVK